MAKKLWGGRFKKPIDKDFEKFSQSIQYDYKLARVDVFHSLLHTFALRGSKLLTNDEAKKIISALYGIQKKIDKGEFVPDMNSEDIHTDVHNRLEKKIGRLANKVHTLRSRNDQIAFNEKLYSLNEAIAVKDLLKKQVESLLFLAKEYKGQPFIGYTHTQRAQVILFSDYLTAYGHMFYRDMRRIANFYEAVVPFIGAGALAGSSLDRKEYDKAIDHFFPDEKKRPKSVENALDNVSERDFLIEFLSILSLVQMHLSRFAEDMILYSTQEFDYVDLPEEFCTGSSLMPHKKNPDFLELVRGYTGRIYANQFSLMTTMKGLPLSYNRDMQLDKEPLFSSVETVKEELQIMVKFIKGIRLKKEIIAEALEDECLYATELAEFLVQKGVAFKDAHDAVGRLIRHISTKKGGRKPKISEMTNEQLKKFHARFNVKDVKKVLNPGYAVASKRSINRKVPKIDA